MQENVKHVFALIVLSMRALLAIFCSNEVDFVSYLRMEKTAGYEDKMYLLYPMYIQINAPVVLRKRRQPVKTPITQLIRFTVKKRV